MVLNRFYINIVVRVVFISITGSLVGLVFTHLENGYYFTLAGVIILLVIQTYMLIGKVNRTNKDLEKFFSSVQDYDTAIRFAELMPARSFGKLYERMNKVNSVIQKSRLENESTGLFLQQVIDHLDVGLLSFNRNGKVVCLNRNAGKYLNVQKYGLISSLEKSDGALYSIVEAIKPGQQILHKMSIDRTIHSILLKAADISLENSKVKLVSFENITSELDKKELESWQRLIRVLTHEIMNSISPITSLTSVISGYFKNPENDSPLQLEEINSQLIHKTLAGLNTIEETGKGLLNFVEKYRSFTLLPEPKVSSIAIDSLFERCALLMESEFSGNIRINSEVFPEGLTLNADYAQVEQIMINLIKNSAEALRGRKNGVIQLKAFLVKDERIIRVEDNGIGISKAIMEDIFIPFYTTKGNGSGIGLSLSKQIMQNHNGTIAVDSVPGEGTMITLKFPA